MGNLKEIIEEKIEYFKNTKAKDNQEFDEFNTSKDNYEEFLLFLKEAVLKFKKELELIDIDKVEENYKVIFGDFENG